MHPSICCLETIPHLRPLSNSHDLPLPRVRADHSMWLMSASSRTSLVWGNMFVGTFHPSSYPQIPNRTQEGGHRPGSSDFVCNCFLCNKLQSYESNRHWDSCPTRSTSRRRDLPDTILVQIISGTLCAVRITIPGLNPEGLAQNFSGIEKHLWRLCRGLTSLNVLRPGALLPLSRYLAPQIPALLYKAQKGDSLPWENHSTGDVNMRMGSLSCSGSVSINL